MKILSCGAGQQSTALALMSCENAMSEKIIYPLVPVYDAVLFCDLGGEREWVYKQVAFISECCQKAGIPFYILKNKNLKKDYMTNYGKARVCTIPFWSIDESGKMEIIINVASMDQTNGGIKNTTEYVTGLRYGRMRKMKYLCFQTARNPGLHIQNPHLFDSIK